MFIAKMGETLAAAGAPPESFDFDFGITAVHDSVELEG